ncbi:MAG: hypothetical protein QNJ29_08965 [Rhizobiaceae bacterium]|nr:hypothetical protein [Rhizobiaceae bacterium]
MNEIRKLDQILNDDGHSGSSGHALEPTILRLRERLLVELEQTETSDEFKSAPVEQRMKMLGGIFKTLQGVEDMINRIKQDNDLEQKRGIDVVEFRRQLEEQIARLVEQENSQTVSGETQ